jgi:PadR family transcriptional regulator, regulatory protein AphA
MVRLGSFAPYASLRAVSSADSEQQLRLTETSYIVLGLLEQGEPATPYDLKRFAQLSTNNFWSVPHTQLYTECARLAAEGLLDERQEETGRRRRIYRLTKRGREALEAWRSEPASDLYELRDAATLKLFFGGDPKTLARAQVESHSRRLEEYEQLRKNVEGLPEGQRLALDCGIGHEREFIRFWTRVASGEG